MVQFHQMINFSNKSFDEIQSYLAKYKLFSFTHRVFMRLDFFIFKIVNNKCPPYLNEKLVLVNDSDIIANYLVPELISKDHSKDMINQSDHFNTLNIPKKSLGVGERTFEYFGAIFNNKFIAGCKLNKLYDFKQYLHKNL